MLFTVDNNNDYFNLNNSNVLPAKDGFEMGNMFKDEYDSYKNYKPKELNPKSNQEADLLEISALSFAVNDLNLKLDIEPNNMELFRLFKKYAKELDQKVRDYSEKYESLEVCLDTDDKYTWYESPWPWEGNKNV